MPTAGQRLGGWWEWPQFKSSAQERDVGMNPYTAELLQLEQCTPVVAQAVVPQLVQIKTPLRVEAWKRRWINTLIGSLLSTYCGASVGASELDLIIRDAHVSQLVATCSR